jgi:hypothetical protein
MRVYDIQIVDEHICRTDPSQKVLDSWVRIKKDAAEALKPSHNSTKPKIKPISCRGCKAIPVSKMCNECKEFSNHTA